MSRGFQRALLRLLLAVAGGVTSSLAMPRENISPLIFVSVGLLLASIKDLRSLPGLLIGFAGGLSFYLSQIEWMSLYLGPVPLLALSTLEAIIFAVGMWAIARVWQQLEQSLAFSSRFRVVIIAAAIACIWTAREWVSTHLPYGGFPWSTLSQTQADSYLSRWVFVGGLPWLTFVLAFTTALITVWLLDPARNLRHVDIPAFTAAVLVLTIPLVIVIPTDAEVGHVRIGAVQGNANAGLFANPLRGSILQNHLDASKKLKYFYPKVDVVVWPENASDLSPFQSTQANLAITNFVNNEIKAPLVFGTITERGSNIYNSSILWKPSLGATDWYDKKRPVPFAEYVPDREFWYSLAPDLVGLISRGYTFGTRDGIFEINKINIEGQYQTVKLGALICFEIAVDEIGRDLVRDGAQVILSQTNNADFGHSDETYQQAAYARLRAIETGRTVVNVSTVGVSAIYGPNGTVIKQLPTFEAGAMIETISLRTSLTPAILVGQWLDLIINVVAALLIATSVTPRAYRLRFGAGAKRFRKKLNLKKF